MVNSFGTCCWHPDQGLSLICQYDRDKFPLLTIAVFQCIKADQDWLTVQYGSDVYRVKPEIFKLVTAPKFLVGENVFVSAKNKIGQVYSLTWHFKGCHHIYLISFNGKRSSRRYMEVELSAVE